MKFKVWLEEIDALESQRDQEIKDIWNDVFKSLQIGGPPKADMVRKSLQDITSGYRRQESASTTVMNRLKDIFQRLENLNNPEVTKRVHDAMEWLGHQPDNHGDNVQPKKTVEELLRKLFGEKFDELLTNTERASDMKDDVDSDSLKKIQPASHAPDSTANANINSDDGEAMPDQMGIQPNPTQVTGQQPQIPPQNPMMRPTNPMPPKPAGSNLGLF